MALSYSHTFSPGTTAFSAEVNANFSSVATYVNAYLTSSQVLSPDGGTVGAPSFSRVGDTNTGMYFSGADTLAWSCGNSKKLELSATALTVTGNLLFPDATHDIGAAGATRPRDMFLSRNAVVGGTLAVTGTTTLTGAIVSNLIFTDATFDIGAAGATRPRDFHLSRNALMGGTLGVTGAATAASVGTTGAVSAFTGTGTPAGGASGTAFFLGSASFGIYFGSGAPSVSAAKGSLYLRSDGSNGLNRAYINSDGGTTWQAINTAA